MKQLFLILFLCAASCKIGFAQSWEKSYGTTSSSLGAFDIVEGENGNMFVTEYEYQNGRSYLTKYNQYGDKIWSKLIDTCYQTIDISICIIRNYALYISAVNSVGNPYIKKPAIYKFDFNGNLIWKKFIPMPTTYQRAYHKIVATEDNRLVLCGYIDHTVFTIEGVIDCFDTNGNLLWHKGNYIEDKTQQYVSIVARKNTVLVTGFEISGGISKKVLTCMDSNGKILWQKFPQEQTRFEEVSLLSDGNFLYHGTILYNTSSSLYLEKLDPSGNLIWAKEFPDAPEYFKYVSYRSITNAINGEFYIFRSIPFMFFRPAYHSQMVRFNNDGKLLNQRFFNNKVVYGSFYSKTLKSDFVAGINYSDDRSISHLLMRLGASSFLSGKIFQDSIKNCQFDAIEKPFPTPILKFSKKMGEDIVINPDSDGKFRLPIDTGAYKIETNIEFPWQNCATPNFTCSYGDTTNILIPIQPIISCPRLTVSLSTQRLRRCFESYYQVKYCNKGTIAANNSYVEIDFDKWLDIQNASVPYSKLNGNKYRFDIGKVEVLDCGTFSVTVKVDCDSTVLGQTHCSTAHIYPDTLCQDDARWDGSSISLKAQCTGNKVKFNIQNIGNQPTVKDIPFFVVEDEILMFQSSTKLNAGQSKDFEFPVNGKTYRIIAAQAAFHPSGNAIATTAVEWCGQGNNTLGFLTQYAEADAEPFIDIDCTQNIGAFDPNDKVASPKGLTNKHLVEANTDIEYQINFQNTGTDTAFNIVLRDTIDKALNISTIEFGASSHPYTWEVNGTGVATIVFPNIQLPDSTVSKVNSQGFIRYRLAQKKNNPNGTIIKNRAAIYFDFNAPIFTNTTFHEVGKIYKFVAVKDAETPNTLTHSVFPNPLTAYAIFKLENTENEAQDFGLKIYDSIGNLIFQTKFSNNQYEFNEKLPNGIYFYQIDYKNQRVGSGKLIVY